MSSDLELAGLTQFLSHLIAGPHQPLLLVGALAAHLAIEAAVDHLEIEHRELGRLGRARGSRPANINIETRSALMIVTCGLATT